MAPSKVEEAYSNNHATAGMPIGKQTTLVAEQSKGPGLDYQKLISKAALRRPASPIRSLFPAELIPGMISFLAGKPNAETFPLAEISMTLKDAGKGKDATQLAFSGKELESALQYGATAGLPPLVAWLKEFQSRFHSRIIVKSGDESQAGHHDWSLQVGHGSQDFLTKVFNTLLDPHDSCLVERPVYAGAMPHLQVLEINIVAVESDEEGMMATSLQEVLSGWNANEHTQGKPFPKFVLTTPTGANPSGTTASEERKRQVLQVIREYGILLIEDDPYALLAFDGLDDVTPAETRKRCRSYWSLEAEDAALHGTGWVLRMDSFSKVVSAGIRMGFLTGPTKILQFVEADTAVSNLQPSGIAQMVVFKLLEHWGYQGFLRHGDQVARFYRSRRDNFEAKARLILGANDEQKAVASWVTPVAGMFLWLRLKLPPTEASQEGDSFTLISEKAKQAGVLAVPGLSFMPDGRSTCYVRTSYSLIPEDQVEQGLRRLRLVIEQAWSDSENEMPK